MIIKTCLGDLSWFWLSCSGPLAYLLQHTFTSFGFPISWLWTYL